MSNKKQQFDLFIRAYDSVAVHLVDLSRQQQAQLVSLPECKVIKTGLPYHWMNMVRCLNEQLLEHMGDEDSLAKWFYKCEHHFLDQETRKVLPFDFMIPNTFTKLASFFERNLHSFGLTREHHFAMGTSNVDSLLSLLEERVKDRDVGDVASFTRVETSEQMAQYLEALGKGFKFPVTRELVDFYGAMDFKGNTGLGIRYYAKSKPLNDAVSTVQLFFPPECEESAILLEQETIERERNQGISTALLYHCVKHALQSGKKQVFIVSNANTQKMHTSLGFQEIGEFVVYKYIAHPRRIGQQE